MHIHIHIQAEEDVKCIDGETLLEVLQACDPDAELRDAEDVFRILGRDSSQQTLTLQDFFMAWSIFREEEDGSPQGDATRG